MNVENIGNQSFIQLEKEEVLRAFSSEELVIELLKRNKGLELLVFEILKKKKRYEIMSPIINSLFNIRI